MKTSKPKKNMIFEPDKIIKTNMIAPCGINCALCLAHLREKNHCPGCRNIDENTPKSCIQCARRLCPNLKDTKSGLCYECKDFPCKRIKLLDKRYRERYGVYLIENLEYIKANGKRKFIEKEKKQWTCTECGGVLCMHRSICITCKTQHNGKRSGK